MPYTTAPQVTSIYVTLPTSRVTRFYPINKNHGFIVGKDYFAIYGTRDGQEFYPSGTVNPKVLSPKSYSALPAHKTYKPRAEVRT